MKGITLFRKALCTAGMLLLTCLCVQAQNPKPFVIPELKEWQGKKGDFMPTSQTRIVCDAEELLPVARQFAEDYEAMFGVKPEVTTGKSRNGDFRYHGRIVFTGNTVRTFDSQVIYALSVDRLEITGNRFIQSRDYPPIFDGLSYIDLQYCREADISGNRFEGDRTVEVSAVACDTVRLDPRQAGFALAVVNKPNTFFYKQ